MYSPSTLHPFFHSPSIQIPQTLPLPPQFPSAHFYEGRLRDSDSVRDMPPAPFYAHPLMKPYVFFDVAKGKEQRREGGGSLSNRVREGVVRGVVVGVECACRVPAACCQS